jgi:hypothetical protein
VQTQIASSPPRIDADKFHLDDGLTRVRADHELRVLDVDSLTIETKHQYLLEATRSARLFQRRYTWTGRGVENRPVVDPSPDGAGHTTHRLQGPVILEQAQKRIMVVDLGRTLTEGKRTVVTVSHRFVDTAGDFDRRLGHAAYPGCQHISLKVTLPPGTWKVVRVVRHVGEEQHTDRQPMSGVDTTIGRASAIEYFWEIPEPEPLMSYSLTWK